MTTKIFKKQASKGERDNPELFTSLQILYPEDHTKF